MLRKVLESKVGKLTDAEFAVVCEIVTDDIKFNRISFKKRTSLEYVMNVAERSAEVFKKCA